MYKMMILPILALYAPISNAINVNSIDFKLSPKLNARYSVELLLKKNAKQIFTLKANNEKGESVFNNLQIYDFNRIDYKINYKSDNNVEEQDRVPVTLSGKLILSDNRDNPLKKIKAEDVSISLDSNLGFKISCKDLFKLDKSGDKLSISLDKMKNLSNCNIKGESDFDLSKIGQRGLDKGFNFFSIDIDKQLGENFANEFDKENKESILDPNHPLSLYLQNKMEQIAAVSDNPQIKPRVRVINANVMNAFALPGGYVYVFRGLIEQLNDFDAIMGVLGHEWAHVTARHGTKGLTRARSALVAATVIGGLGAISSEVFIKDNGNEARKLLKGLISMTSLFASRLGAALFILDRGRDQEREADKIGSQYAHLAGFGSNGIAKAFRVFEELNPQNSIFLEKILSSHPQHKERITKNLVQSNLFLGGDSQNDHTISYINGQKITFSEALAHLEQLQHPDNTTSEEIANAFINKVNEQNENVLLGELFNVLKQKGKIEDN